MVLIFAWLQAQSREEPDSVKVIMQELDRISDSTVEPPAQEDIEEEGYKDEPAADGSIYFLNKQLQANGGGPDSLLPRKLPDSILKKLKADNDFWYANYSFAKKEKEKEKATVPFFEGAFFQTILWLVIIGGFAAFVILYLSNSNVRLFRRANKTIGAADDNAEVETDNIFEINYQREIDKAVANGNYRLAVRLLFLRLLKNLSDKKIIQYKQDRTNFDYLVQVHATKYYPDFFRLTRNYEYSWYGQFDIEPEKFTVIKNDFENFDRNLK